MDLIGVVQSQLPSPASATQYKDRDLIIVAVPRLADAGTACDGGLLNQTALLLSIGLDVPD